MNGTNAATGKRLGGFEHLRQSIRDILTTPIGSRVMRREYGSKVMRLIDAPMNRSTLLEVYAAVTEALERWEPRFRLELVQATSAVPGRLELDVSGIYLPDGQSITLEGIVVQ